MSGSAVIWPAEFFPIAFDEALEMGIIGNGSSELNLSVCALWYLVFCQKKLFKNPFPYPTTIMCYSYN
jgi:hypothetical protein